MTTRQRHIYKLGNAIRAYRGSPSCPPQKSALVRVKRWLTRCLARGYVARSEAPNS